MRWLIPCAVMILRNIIAISVLPSCRYVPTCSAYAIEALRRHGFIKGTGRALWRLGRCHPFCRGGIDPAA